nr:serine protease [Rhodoferax sp. BLA1]
MVSIWTRRDSSAAEDFLCTGVFVSDTWILTAKHAAQTGKNIWASATASGPNSYSVVERQLHDDLDVALLRVESSPAGSSFLPCNAQVRYEQLNRPITLVGFFEGRLEAAQDLDILRFAEADRHYLTGLKQPYGQSGSPVCSGGSIWAIAVRHYADGNTHRGCVIAVHQFVTWLQSYVPNAVIEEQTAAPPGWDVIDPTFLQTAAATIRTGDLSEYFDGEDPLWPTISTGRIPVRAAVGVLLDRLLDARNRVESAHLIIGPGGEGKTTVVMQAAAILAKQKEWRVLFRRSGGDGYGGRLHWDDLAPHIKTDTALCLLIDDAHEVRQEVADFLRRDRVDGVVGRVAGASVHLVLCTHKDDWARAEKNWPREIWRPTELHIAGLSKSDALQVIRGYRNEASLGLLDPDCSNDALADLLVAKADTLGQLHEAALLGALIEARTGLPLDVHVERILVRAATAANQTGLPVSKCLVFTAAANSAGLHRLRHDVLRLATEHSDQEVGAAIGTSASELRIEGFGAGQTVRVRHSAIARQVARFAFDAASTASHHFDKALVFRKLSFALVRTVPRFWCSPAAAPLLNLAAAYRMIDPTIAVAVAEGAVEGAPDNDHLRSHLAQTHRETSKEGAQVAWETCREFFEHYPTKLMLPTIRALVLEWAVSAGECIEMPDRGAQNAWLALLSFSDQWGGQELPLKHARHLPTITMGLKLMGDSLKDDLAGRVAAAILLVGRAIAGTHHLGEVDGLAKQAKKAVSRSDLEPILSELSCKAWDFTSTDFRAQSFFPHHGALTFRLLATTVAQNP